MRDSMFHRVSHPRPTSGLADSRAPWAKAGVSRTIRVDLAPQGTRSGSPLCRRDDRPTTPVGRRSTVSKSVGYGRSDVYLPLDRWSGEQRIFGHVDEVIAFHGEPCAPVDGVFATLQLEVAELVELLEQALDCDRVAVDSPCQLGGCHALGAGGVQQGHVLGRGAPAGGA